MDAVEILGKERRWRFPMKTITSFLTAAILVSGAASAMADQQRSDESVGYSLSQQAARGSGGANASARRGHSEPYASAWSENNVRVNPGFSVGNDFGDDQNIINFQAQGSH
jgi:hypothetical protein